MARGSPDWMQYAPQKTLIQLLRENSCFYAETEQPAVAGKFSLNSLWNPDGSGVDALIWVVGYTAGAASDGFLRFIQDPYGVQGDYATTRRAFAYTESCIPYKHTLAAKGYGQMLGHYSVTTSWQRDKELYIWLTPGWGIAFELETANTKLQTSWIWFEFLEY